MIDQSEYIYTINSNDPEHYNRIFCSLDIPNTEYSVFSVTELATKCCILILTTKDYFTINNKSYFFVQDYTDLNSESFVEIVDDMIANDGYYCELDTASRIHFFAVNEFELGEMSYNCKLLFGLHNIETPIISKYNPLILTEQKQEIIIDSVGFTLSTPVLYLLSNLGAKTFKNKLDDTQSKTSLSTLKTAMRINNSFSANYPIVSGNSDFETIIKSNDLSNVSFFLVDANLNELTLLSPLYLTIHVKAIPDEDHNIYNLLLQQQMQQEQMQNQK